MTNAAPQPPPRPTETTAVLAPGQDDQEPLAGALGTLEARIRSLALGAPRQEDLLTDTRILGVELEKASPDPDRVAELGRELLQAEAGLLWPFVAVLLEGRTVDSAVRREFQEAPTRRLPPEEAPPPRAVRTTTRAAKPTTRSIAKPAPRTTTKTKKKKKTKRS